ncbi:MAG: lactate utilization protein [Verrucomicrobiae bacterium]|nr:lactate utilization protein [Verrucomicrobiae bacterium]
MTLRQQFEQRFVQAGGTLASVSELDALLTGRVFVSAHPICARWVARANCADPREADVSLTGCDALVAETGSIAVLSGPVESRVSTLVPPVHVVIAAEDQLVADMEGAFEKFAERLRPGDAAASLVFITGPSRTADIEKTLVTGVHGPQKLVFVFAPAGG